MKLHLDLNKQCHNQNDYNIWKNYALQLYYQLYIAVTLKHLYNQDMSAWVSLECPDQKYLDHTSVDHCSGTL